MLTAYTSRRTVPGSCLVGHGGSVQPVHGVPVGRMGRQGTHGSISDILISRGAISTGDRGWGSSPRDAAWKCTPLCSRRRRRPLGLPLPAARVRGAVRALANDGLLELGQWQERWDSSSWRQYLREKDSEEETAAIRECTHTGRPLGTAEFVRAMETITQRRLIPLKRGRSKKVKDERQGVLSLEGD